MDHSGIRHAVALAGDSPAALARLIGGGIKRQHVEHWLSTGRVPAEHCAVIELGLGQRVRRWQLRPKDWHRIWPELVGVEGAPEAAPLPSVSEVSSAA